MIILLLSLLIINQNHPWLCSADQYFNQSNLDHLSETRSLSKTGCRDSCGEILIPYPFGVTGSDPTCYYNKWYEIYCNTSFDPPRPFLKHLNVEFVGVTLMQQVDTTYPKQSLAVRTIMQDICSTGVTSSLDLRGSPFRFFTNGNMFIAHGCSGIIVRNRTRHILAACNPICDRNSSDYDDHKGEISLNNSVRCDTLMGCCFALFDRGVNEVDYYTITLEDASEVGSHGCNTTVFLTDSVSSSQYSGTILQWRTPDKLLDYQDHQNFTCYEDEKVCVCKPPYVGNPYLPYGCRVDCHVYGWHRRCKRSHHELIIIGIAPTLVLLCGGYCIHSFVKRAIEIKQKSKNFKRNGGLLLRQHISPNGGVVNKTKVFTLTELERATDNFNENRILGQGGQGTVFKGMMEDGKIVAIKKSIKVNEDRLEQFINEVVIVSQINHRNVVKLLGCCLETEVPLLVYEFIPNGTLYHHIHHPSVDFCVTWKMRLQIAAESAGALAHLHSSTSPPIYHRDIKSSNILLDEKYKAKVSDFGTSKAIAIDQSHVTTCVRGTYGYLDPEYFQSNQFTEKSDVYSFGVVLVELITSKKPICRTSSGEWISLAGEFLFHMDNCTLNGILDTRVLEEGEKEEMVAVAEIARKCLKMNGKFRPTMKEVAKVLEEIRSPNHFNIQRYHYVKNNQVISNMNVLREMSLPNIELSSFCSVEVEPLMINTF